jgi:hypothetical protein
MSADLRRAVPLLVLFVLGLGAGIWVFVAPWVLGYPLDHGTWTGSIWTGVWAGGILAVASAACLVAVLASTVHAVRRPPEPGAE